MSEKIISSEIINVLKSVGFTRPTLLSRINQASYTISYQGELSSQQHYAKLSDFNKHFIWLTSICNGNLVGLVDLYLCLHFDDDKLIYEIDFNGCEFDYGIPYSGVELSDYHDDLHYFDKTIPELIDNIIIELTSGGYAKANNIKNLVSKI